MKSILVHCLAAILLLTGVLQAADPIRPDPKLTPGAVLPAATVEQVCSKGYANVINGGVRNVPEAIKRKVFISYFGKVPDNTKDYEIDHLCSLCLGGSNDIANLWPQSYITTSYNAHVKDRLEDCLYARVRKDLKLNGHDHATALLRQYQTEISKDWIASYTQYLGDPAAYHPSKTHHQN